MAFDFSGLGNVPNPSDPYSRGYFNAALQNQQLTQNAAQLAQQQIALPGLAQQASINYQATNDLSNRFRANASGANPLDPVANFANIFRNTTDPFVASRAAVYGAGVTPYAGLNALNPYLPASVQNPSIPTGLGFAGLGQIGAFGPQTAGNLYANNQRLAIAGTYNQPFNYNNALAGRALVLGSGAQNNLYRRGFDQQVGALGSVSQGIADTMTGTLNAPGSIGSTQRGPNGEATPNPNPGGGNSTSSPVIDRMNTTGAGATKQTSGSNTDAGRALNNNATPLPTTPADILAKTIADQREDIAAQQKLLQENIAEQLRQQAAAAGTLNTGLPWTQ